MKRYGFFGGSFNPPTKAHEELAKEIMKEFNLDKLFFVPVGNTYQKNGLIDEKDRYRMLNILFEEEEKIEVSDLELQTKQILKAIDVFSLIEEKYKHEEIFYIMGDDNLEKTPNWKAAEELLKNHKFIILKRNNKELKELIQNSNMLWKYKENFYESKMQKLIPYSSSQVRKAIQLGNTEEIEKMVNPKVYQYITEKNLYQ